MTYADYPWSFGSSLSGVRAHWCLVYHLGFLGPGHQLPGKARKSWYAVPIFMKKLVRIMCILLETRDGVGVNGGGGEKNWG